MWSRVNDEKASYNAMQCSDKLRGLSVMDNWIIPPFASGDQFPFLLVVIINPFLGGIIPS